MIMNGLPESQPEIQNTQSAGQAAHEAAGNEIAQAGPSQQKRVISPPGGPGQNDQQHAKRGTQGYEQQGTSSQEPYF
jgi:hypothetical protein